METTQVEETLSPRLRDPVGSPVEPPAPGFSWGGAGIRWGSSCTSGAPPVTGPGDPHPWTPTAVGSRSPGLRTRKRVDDTHNHLECDLKGRVTWRVAVTMAGGPGPSPHVRLLREAGLPLTSPALQPSGEIYKVLASFQHSRPPQNEKGLEGPRPKEGPKIPNLSGICGQKPEHDPLSFVPELVS